MIRRKLLSDSIPNFIKKRIDRSKLLSFLAHNGDARVIHQHGSAFILSGLSNKIEKKILSGDYDRINNALLSNLIHEGHVCLDVGANIGAYSVTLSRLCSPGGIVYSFEPVRHIRRKLHLNIAVNGARNVYVNDFGLGDIDTELEMHQVKEGVFRAGTSSFVKNPTIQAMGDEQFDVETAKVRTLDGFVSAAGLQKIDFIKIDVEGFEMNVLRGGREAVQRFRPSIIMEFDYDRHGEQSDEFAQFFADNRYEVLHCRSIGQHLVTSPFDFSFQPKERNLLCLPLGM